jgi:hypothetical protein
MTALGFAYSVDAATGKITPIRLTVLETLRPSDRRLDLVRASRIDAELTSRQIRGLPMMAQEVQRN